MARDQRHEERRRIKDEKRLARAAAKRERKEDWFRTMDALFNSVFPEELRPTDGSSQTTGGAGRW